MVRPSGVRLAAGAEFGWLGGHVDLGDRSRLLAALEKFGSPGDIDPGVPWVAVIVRADRTALLAASTMSTSGLFWTIDIVRGSPTLLWSEDLGVVVRSRHSPTSLDAGWLSAYARGESTLTATPYADVHRVPPGRAAAVDAQGAPSVTAWLKASWGEPDLDLEPAIREFRSVFDCAVRRLTLGRTTHAIALSGGLDSTYAAACVAGSLKPGAQAIGYVSSPLPALSHNPSIHAIADDLPTARILHEHYADRLDIEAVVNWRHTCALDLAESTSRRTWWPVPAPDNWVWLADMAGRAADRGADQLLMGTHGNWAFSRAWARVVRGGQGIRRLHRLVRAVPGLPPRRWLGETRRAPAASARVGLLRPSAAAAESGSGTARERYLAGLAMEHATSGPALGSAAFGGVLRVVDPFTAPDVLAVAARIRPAAWACEPWPRGFARRVAEGSVPDAVRLRVERGAQAPDAWLWMADRRDRYLAEVDALAKTSTLAELVDIDSLRREVRSWPWGERIGPRKPATVAVNRILALGAFVRMTEVRLSQLPTTRR